MRPLIKICGITSRTDAMLSIEAGADALGFIFYEKSRRCVSPAAAAAICGLLPKRILTVGVFVNEPRTMIEETIRITGIRAIQLSGDEEPADCTGYPVEVWKAFRISSVGQAGRPAEYPVDAVLLDGARDGEYGGSGERADIEVARYLQARHRLILAGGLTPYNITAAIRDISPAGVDVNSGVEMAPGKKDPRKLNALRAALSTISSSSSTRVSK